MQAQPSINIHCRHDEVPLTVVDQYGVGSLVSAVRELDDPGVVADLQGELAAIGIRDDERLR